MANLTKPRIVGWYPIFLVSLRNPSSSSNFISREPVKSKAFFTAIGATYGAAAHHFQCWISLAGVGYTVQLKIYILQCCTIHTIQYCTVLANQGPSCSTYCTMNKLLPYCTLLYVLYIMILLYSTVHVQQCVYMYCTLYM